MRAQRGIAAAVPAIKWWFVISIFVQACLESSALAQSGSVSSLRKSIHMLQKLATRMYTEELWKGEVGKM